MPLAQYSAAWQQSEQDGLVESVTTLCCEPVKKKELVRLLSHMSVALIKWVTMCIIARTYTSLRGKFRV